MKSYLNKILVSFLSFNLINASSLSFALDKKGMEIICETLDNTIPPEVKDALELEFKKFCLNPRNRVILKGNLPSNLVKEFFKDKTYQEKNFVYFPIRISDDSVSVESVKLILEKAVGPKLILLSDIFCKDAKKCIDIFNLLKKTQNIFVYIEGTNLCSDKSCKDCVQLINLANRAESEGLLNNMFFTKIESDFYKQWITNLMVKWKELNEKGNLDIKVNLSDDDIEAISTWCEKGARATLSQVKKFIENAFAHASIRNSDLEFIDFAKLMFDKIVRSNSIVPIDIDQEDTALHECAHALILHLEGLKLLWISVHKSGDGATYFDIPPSRYVSYKKLLSQIKGLMAGNIAEELFSERGINHGADYDYDKIKYMLNEAVVIKDRTLEYKTEEKTNAVNALFNELYKETMITLKENEKLLKRLAERLLKRESVSNIKLMRRDEFLKSIDEIKEEIKNENESYKRLEKVLKDNPDLLRASDLSKKFLDHIESYVKDTVSSGASKTK